MWSGITGARAFTTGFRLSYDLLRNLRFDVTAFPPALACFTGLALKPGVGILSLLCLRYFAEATHSWTVEAINETSGQAASLNTN